MAEAFLAGSVALAVVASAGLFAGRVGGGARIVTGLGALYLIVAAARVGHSGGELVYRHGAAGAYTSGRPAATGASAASDTHP
jgi:hypothetical protein